MDYYGNIVDAKGQYVGTDYYASQAWAEAKAANDALQAAVAAARAAEDSGTSTPAAVETANKQVSAALVNYNNATASHIESAPESHLDPELTDGSRITLMPAPGLMLAPASEPTASEAIDAGSVKPVLIAAALVAGLFFLWK